MMNVITTNSCSTETSQIFSDNDIVSGLKTRSEILADIPKKQKEKTYTTKVVNLNDPIISIQKRTISKEFVFDELPTVEVPKDNNVDRYLQCRTPKCKTISKQNEKYIILKDAQKKIDLMKELGQTRTNTLKEAFENNIICVMQYRCPQCKRVDNFEQESDEIIPLSQMKSYVANIQENVALNGETDPDSSDEDIYGQGVEMEEHINMEPQTGDVYERTGRFGKNFRGPMDRAEVYETPVLNDQDEKVIMFKNKSGMNNRKETGIPFSTLHGSMTRDSTKVARIIFVKTTMSWNPYYAELDWETCHTTNPETGEILGAVSNPSKSKMNIEFKKIMGDENMTQEELNACMIRLSMKENIQVHNAIVKNYDYRKYGITQLQKNLVGKFNIFDDNGWVRQAVLNEKWSYYEAAKLIKAANAIDFINCNPMESDEKENDYNRVIASLESGKTLPKIDLSEESLEVKGDKGSRSYPMFIDGQWEKVSTGKDNLVTLEDIDQEINFSENLNNPSRWRND